MLAGQKNNLSLAPGSLAYSMETAANGAAARLVYKGKTQTTVRELLEAPAEVGIGLRLRRLRSLSERPSRAAISWPPNGCGGRQGRRHNGVHAKEGQTRTRGEVEEDWRRVGLVSSQAQGY